MSQTIDRMNPRPRPAHRHARSLRQCRTGIALVEVVLSTVIIGTLAASVLSVVGVSAQRGAQSLESKRAAWLARDLMAEIASRPCAFRIATETLDGLASGDLDLDKGGVLTRDDPKALPDRTAFNDLFDYDSWESTPPVDYEGTEIPGFSGWTRWVDVDAIDPGTLNKRAFNDTAAMITVVVSRNGRTIHTETMIRTQAMDTLREGTNSGGTKITELEGDLGR